MVQRASIKLQLYMALAGMVCSQYLGWEWVLTLRDRQKDLDLPKTHPKRVLIDRTLELEVRLSYFDRVRDTLPDAYKEAGIMNGEAPTYSFTYAAEGEPFG